MCEKLKGKKYFTLVHPKAILNNYIYFSIYVFKYIMTISKRRKVVLAEG